MRFNVLGPLQAWRNGEPAPLGPPKQRLLLAIMLCQPGEVLPTDYLVDVLWPEPPPRSARENLRGYVHRLRAVLGADVLVGHRPGYTLAVSPDQVDSTRFVALAERCAAALAAGDAKVAREDAGAALALWGGEPFREFDDVAALTPERQRLGGYRMAVLEHRVEADLRLGRAAELVPELTDLVARHPYRERFCAQLMLALYRSGRQADALAEYRRMHRTLAAELGIEPQAKLRTLHEAMLRGDPGLLAVRSRDAGVGVARPAAGTNLPLDIADFTGRQEHIAAVRTRLTATPAVVAIAGKAGVGKTSFAVHVAHGLREMFPDGQLFVSLAGTGGRARTAQEAQSGILLLLGIRRADVPAGLAPRSEFYHATLAHRRVLLVLDNAADEVQVRPLVPWGTGSAVIVTSRRPLAALEPAYHLVLPELSDVESTDLLANVAGAPRVTAEPEAAAHLVTLCGRLPLAIRIAGAKLAAKPHWALWELVQRLTDERGRLDELAVGDLAVRASLALTYRALDPRAQHVFRVIGQLDRAEFPAWVAATLVGSPMPEVAEVLERLVDWHILDVAQRDAAGRQRYRLHELLAVFARELEHTGTSVTQRQAAMGQALATWLTVFDAMEARLVREARTYDRPHNGPTASYPLGWLPAHSSALAATAADTTTTIVKTGWAVTATLVAMSFELWSQWDNWHMTRAVATYSGRRAGDRLITDSWEIKPGQELPWADAAAALEQCLRTFQEIDELSWHAVSMLSLGNLYRARACFDLAGRTLRNSVGRFHALGHRDWEAAALFSLGSLRVVDGELSEAVASFQNCLEIFGDLGDTLWQAYTRRALGYAYQQHGRYAEAVAELEAALPVFREHDDSMWEAHTSLTLGLARLGLRQTDRAVDELGTSVATFQRYGDPRSEAIALRALAHAEIGRGRTAIAEEHLHSSLAVFGRLENTIGTPLALCEIGTLCERAGRHEEAARYLAPAEQIFAQLDLRDLPHHSRLALTGQADGATSLARLAPARAARPAPSPPRALRHG